MPTAHVMKYFNRVFRCGKLYRNVNLPSLGLDGGDQPFILSICRNPGISQDELSKDIYIDKSAVARRVAALEKNGYVRRESDPGDKRVLRVFPTEKAIAVRPAIWEANDRWNELITEGLTDEEKEKLEEMLIKVMTNAMRWADENERL